MNDRLQTLRTLIRSSRPISWVNTAYPFGAAYLVAGGQADWLFWVASLFFLIPYNYLMYGLNDVFDYESDLRNPRKGGVEGAIMDKKYHRLVILSTSALAAPFIIWLGLHGSALATSVLLASVFFVIAYSAKGLRFKEIPVLDSVTSSLHFVGPALYALAIFGFPAAAWPYIFAFFLWGIASHALGAVQDIIPDRKADIHSIATVLGAKRVVALALICYSTALIIVSLQSAPPIAIALCAGLYALNTATLLGITDKTSGNAHASWRRFLWMNYLTGAAVTVTLLA